MQELLIFPYSGTGVEALDCLGDKFKCIGFISDDKNVIGTKQLGIEIFTREALEKFPAALVLAVPGGPESFIKRKSIIDGLNISIDRFATIVHPGAHVSGNASIGKNVLIMAGVVITSNAIIEDNVCVLPNTVIHHDSRMGKYTLIGANTTIPGNIQVGENCYIGASVSIRNGVSIGAKTLIGIGANILHDCLPGSKMVGNPAKNINSL
jgi:acetyltransferase EpsM